MMPSRRTLNYRQYSEDYSEVSDIVLTENKLNQTYFNTRSSKRAGWELYKAVYKNWGRYFADGSSHRATFNCSRVQLCSNTPQAVYNFAATEHFFSLMEAVLLNSDVVNFTMRIDAVEKLSQQIVECIIYEDLETGVRHVEDRKRRAEDRSPQIIKNIVDVRNFSADHIIVTTQNTRPGRPYLYGRFEKSLGEMADEEIADVNFRICYKLPKAALSNVYVYVSSGQMYRYILV